MLRRSSGSTEEDDSDETTPSIATLSEPEDSKSSFTSAKVDHNQPSGALDRRKGEKAPLPPPPLNQHAWPAEPHHYPNAGVEKEAQPNRQSVPVVLQDKMVDRWGRPRSRSRSPWRLSVLTLMTTVLGSLLLLSILHSFVARQIDPKGCRMSMMIPAYAKLSDFDTEHTRFASKYSLYLYREVGVDEDTVVKGVPVLFITGNAGSYKQVRPLAAEAARYFHDHLQQNAEVIQAGVRNLDFFTADFNEDITAFHGQTLLDQAEYLNEATAYILSLYHDPRRSRRDARLPDPSSVIVIAHSMGGIVARTMLVMPNYQPNSINTIITMSAPHARPPVSLDAEIVHTYQKINDYWREAYSQRWANANPLWHVTLISITGGGLDSIVPADYASLSSLVPETNGFTVFTSSVPNVWTGSDHLSILWCDQFRKVIVRSLFEAIDVHRPGQTKTRAERMRIFKRWYLTGMEDVAERMLPRTKEPTTLLTLEDSPNTILAAGERLTIRDFGHSGKPRAYLLPIPSNESHERKNQFTLLSDQPLQDSGTVSKLEVLVCSVFPLQAGQSAATLLLNVDLSGTTSGSTRLACINAAPDVILLPASTRTSKHAFEDTPPFSFLQYSIEDLSEHQFVAVVDKSSTPQQGWAIAEFSHLDASQIRTSVGLGRLLTRGFHGKLSAQRPMVVDIKIPALYSSLLAYKLKVGAQACGDGVELFTPLLRQYISEPYESRYFVNVKEANINLHGVAPFMPPPLRGRPTTEGVSLQLWSDPTCNTSMDISLKVDIAGSLGKLYMRYRTAFLAFPLLIVALVLRKQFAVYDDSGIFMTFSEAFDLCLRSSVPILLLAMSFLAISLASAGASTSPSASGGILGWTHNATETTIDYARNDLLLGSQDPFFWFLIPLCGLISAGICVILNYLGLLLIHILYVAYSVLATRPAWLRNNDRSSRRSTAPAFATASPRRRLVTTAILLFAVSTFIPYQFAYMVACIVQIATCTRALRLAKETRSGNHYNFYNYAHSVLILMLWILPINLPVLVVWIHNLAVHWLTPFSSHHNVLSIMPFLLLVETLTSGMMIPRMTSRCRFVTSFLFFFLAVYAAIYGVTYAYQLHHLTNITCAWLVALHFSGSNFTLAGLGRLLEADDDEGRVKKRP